MTKFLQWYLTLKLLHFTYFLSSGYQTYPECYPETINIFNKCMHSKNPLTFLRILTSSL